MGFPSLQILTVSSVNVALPEVRWECPCKQIVISQYCFHHWVAFADSEEPPNSAFSTHPSSSQPEPSYRVAAEKGNYRKNSQHQQKIKGRYGILISYLKHEQGLSAAIAILAGDKGMVIPIFTQRTPQGSPSVAAVTRTGSPCCLFIKTMILAQLFSYWPIFYYCYLIMQGNLQVMFDSQMRRGEKKAKTKNK